jgi:hypothetical protein
MQRSLTKLLSELTTGNRPATLEETQTLVTALKELEKREKIQALVGRIKAIKGA